MRIPPLCLSCALIAGALLLLTPTPAQARGPNGIVRFGLGSMSYTGGKQPVSGVSLDTGAFMNRPVPVDLRGGFDISGQQFNKENPETGLALDLSFGFNWWGVTALVELNGHGWDLTGTAGGSGFVGGVLKIHPVEILAHLGLFFDTLPGRRWDASFALGGGWTIVGRDDVGTTTSGAGQDGSYFRTGFEGEYYLTPIFSVGAELKIFVAEYGKRVFTDYSDRDVKYGQLPAREAVVVAPIFNATLHIGAPYEWPGAQTESPGGL